MELEKKELNGMLETAVDAARLAGRRAMAEMNNVKIQVKSADQLVTQADPVCQQIIVERIKKTYPDDGFIAEEGDNAKLFKQPPAQHPYREKGSRRIWWVIDPIDGTNNFAKGMLLFTVSIAAMYEGEPVVGVIYDPATDSMFTGVKGGQAQFNGRQIAVGDDGFNQFSSVGTDSFFDNGVPGWAIKLMEKARSRTLGSSCLQLAYLAKGSLIGIVFVRPKLWDIAAGVVIAESAGAIVSDWYGNKLFPIDCDNYTGQEIATLGANKKVYHEMLKLLK
ncbi:MAG: inositol monophosphatase [Sedimentisphaerales bacterium]|jgi:myo-inositol-1(or 4)-monophosphatase